MDKHIILHQPADPEEVLRYENSQGEGPVLDDLHFDFMSENSNGSWNIRSCRLIAQKLFNDQFEEHWDLPHRSVNYFYFFVFRKYKRLRRTFRESAARIVADEETGVARLEEEDEVMERLMSNDVIALATQRRSQRRNNASVWFTRCNTHIDVAIAFPPETAHCKRSSADQRIPERRRCCNVENAAANHPEARHSRHELG